MICANGDCSTERRLPVSSILVEHVFPIREEVVWPGLLQSVDGPKPLPHKRWPASKHLKDGGGGGAAGAPSVPPPSAALALADAHGLTVMEQKQTWMLPETQWEI